MAFMTFHSVGNVIIASDELIFFRGVGLNHQTVIAIENILKTYLRLRYLGYIETTKQIVSFCIVHILG
jgi:hypothetical protein